MAAEIGMALNTVPWSHGNADKLKSVSHSGFMDFKIYTNLITSYNQIVDSCLRGFFCIASCAQIKQYEQRGGDKTMYLAQ